MESANDRRAVGEIAQVYAVVVIFTAAVFLISNYQPITSIGCAGIACPIAFTADGVGNGSAS